MGDLLSTQDDYEGALDHYLRASVLEPESSYVHTALAMVYGRQEQHGICYYHLGMADKHAGRYLKALYYFRKARRFVDPKTEVAIQVSKEIKLMEE